MRIRFVFIELIALTSFKLGKKIDRVKYLVAAQAHIQLDVSVILVLLRIITVMQISQ